MNKFSSSSAVQSAFQTCSQTHYSNGLSYRNECFDMTKALVFISLLAVPEPGVLSRKCHAVDKVAMSLSVQLASVSVCSSSQVIYIQTYSCSAHSGTQPL